MCFKISRVKTLGSTSSTSLIMVEKKTTTAIQKTSQNRDPNIKVEMNIPSSKLTVRPWQSSGLEDEFPLQSGDFQGQTVNLLEGNTSNDL